MHGHGRSGGPGRSTKGAKVLEDCASGTGKGTRKRSHGRGWFRLAIIRDHFSGELRVAGVQRSQERPASDGRAAHGSSMV